MQRLTIDKPVSEMTNMELAYNCCVAEEGRAVYRDFTSSVDARQIVAELLKVYEGISFKEEKDIDDFMLGALQEGHTTQTGLIALFYRFIWAMADMREHLKQYEDTGLDPEKIYEMDRLYTEKCKELAEARKELQKYRDLEWTPLTNKTKPEPFEFVYIQTVGGECDILEYIPPGIKYLNHTDGFFGLDTDSFDYDFHDVIAWRPLPKPYREDGVDI